jgi:CRISPR-associated endonuclease/helicase Cas3
MKYESWFERVAQTAPYPWQETLGRDEAPADRVLRIPTGFGKTAGAALAWLYHRCVRNDDRWPRRLRSFRLRC